MDTETITDHDPIALRQAADEARAQAYRLLDEADRDSIRAELSRKLAGAQVAQLIAQGRVESARTRLAEVISEAETAEAEQRERAGRVRAALMAELGAEIADEVSGRLAAAAAVREADQRRVEVAEHLAQAGAPAVVMDAALTALDDRQAAEHRARQDRLSEAKTELSVAERGEVAAAAEVARLHTAIANPLNLTHFELCDSWLARLVRPEIYRKIISAKVNGGQVDELVYSLALASAREQWRLDCALAGDLDQIEAEREALGRAQAELDRLRRAARITPTSTTVRNGVSGWL